ncbi:MAG: pitrilysin family protein [Thermoanaerobaculia bacterium]
MRIRSRVPADCAVSESVGALPPLAVPALPGKIRHRVLRNGMTVCVVEQRTAPVVTSALFYRVGARDETPELSGAAHFLEHMMFKGSERFIAGEIDRRTQALGGVNNAFTSHDLTGYYFDFAADRWTHALEIEADRMRGLTLDPAQVTSERQVILEELSMCESEPWDALEMEVTAALYRPHPYGSPVLGTRESLAGIGAAELAAFHRAWYGPENAVLIVAGDVGEEAFAAAEVYFADLPGGRGIVRMPPASRPEPREMVRVSRRAGEVARVLLALPAPPATHPDHTALRLTLGALDGGKASPLHRAMVEEGQLASWVSCDLGESLDPGHIQIAAELVPGVEPAAAEAALLGELARIRSEGFSAEEIERARQILLADWTFLHERVHQQAITLGAALTLFDLRHPERTLGALARLDADSLNRAARRYLDPERGGVLGWSLPAGEEPEAEA